MKARLKVVDLFCGCGGASLGVKLAGHAVVAAVDVDPVACETYSKNLGLEPLEGDLRVLDGRAVLDHFGLRRGDVDLVIGCPPCQGFSSLRRTTHPDGIDERNDLVWVFLELVEELRPKAFVFENVFGMKNGVGAGCLQLLRDEARKVGFATNSDFLVDAVNYGVPQHRRRVIVVGVDGAKEEPVLPPRKRFDPRTEEEGRAPWKTVRDTIANLPPLEAGEAHPSIKNHVAHSHSPEVMKVIRAVPKDGGSRKDLPRELWLPCHARLGKGAENVYGRMAWDAPSNTITCRCTTPSSGRFLHPEQDRAITIREAARLQTFEDWFVFPDEFHSAERLVGNAVPPEFMAVLVDHMAEVISS